ncbi:MAG TPA: serine/threonine-protein kinase, partial [Candidatus Krumholzibacteria bacterium]
FLVAWAWRRLFAASSVALQDAETMAQRPDLTPTSELPARFGEFTLVSRLGRGGMASVYRAERAGEAAVALKRPQESFLGEEQFIERFLREAELGRALNHPNIIRIFERGEVAGVPYFTMQLLEGATLWHALRAQGRFDPERAVRTVVQVAEGLDFAHSKGVVHRDLKPSNIWLDPDGRIVVMDFGIARARRFEGMTGTGAFLGTPEYISPEVIDGEAASPASDMYALGVIFYELVTGRRPFAGESAFAIFKQHRVTEPEPPSRLAPRLPPELEGIMLALLAKRPADRPASAEALVVSLRDYLNRFQAS